MWRWLGINRRSRISPFIAVIEAEVKEFILRDFTSILAVIPLTYIFTSFLALAGIAVGRDEEGFYRLTGYRDPVAYQAIGSSIIVISMLIVSSIGQYINSASLSGRLEMLLASPARLSVVLISTSIPMMI